MSDRPRDVETMAERWQRVMPADFANATDFCLRLGGCRAGREREFLMTKIRNLDYPYSVERLVRLSRTWNFDSDVDRLCEMTSPIGPGLSGAYRMRCGHGATRTPLTKIHCSTTALHRSTSMTWLPWSMNAGGCERWKRRSFARSARPPSGCGTTGSSTNSLRTRVRLMMIEATPHR
jgi:hypothetical protein